MTRPSLFGGDEIMSAGLDAAVGQGGPHTELPSRISTDNPGAIQILLPVWGYKFVQSMLKFCIPTLLAPNNIPSIAKVIPTKFVVMTRSEDVNLIETHSIWHRLASFCTVEIRTIDDLI